MKMIGAFLAAFGLLLFPQAKEEISPPALASLVGTERAFAKLSADKGVREAFLAYFADDGINFTPGPENARDAMMKRPAGYGPVRLDWAPVFGDVSLAGDLGYTTGPYVSTALSKQQPARHGYFFSIWKLQHDGSWKVVLDYGVPTSGPDPAVGDSQFKAARRIPLNLRGEAPDPEKVKTRLISIDRAIDGTDSSLEAFISHMSEDVRLHRPGVFPQIGKGVARSYLAERILSIRFEPIRADVARSVDLAYTYGSYQATPNARYSTTANRGFYARVWKQVEPGQWRIVLDNAVPLRDEKGQ